AGRDRAPAGGLRRRDGDQQPAGRPDHGDPGTAPGAARALGRRPAEAAALEDDHRGLPVGHGPVPPVPTGDRGRRLQGYRRRREGLVPRAAPARAVAVAVHRVHDPARHGHVSGRRGDPGPGPGQPVRRSARRPYRHKVHVMNRVLVAEDLYLLRDGLVHLLQAHGFEVVAAVESGPELLKGLLELRPDVSIVDVRLPPTLTDEGLQASLEARKKVPGLPILVLSQHVEQLYARELLADGSGGIGYLLKDRVFNAEQFIDAVRRVAAGGTAMDPEVISKLLASNAKNEPLA